MDDDYKIEMNVREKSIQVELSQYSPSRGDFSSTSTIFMDDSMSKKLRDQLLEIFPITKNKKEKK